jgi:hypothetical protein
MAASFLILHVHLKTGAYEVDICNSAEGPGGISTGDYIDGDIV